MPLQTTKICGALGCATYVPLSNTNAGAQEAGPTNKSERLSTARQLHPNKTAQPTWRAPLQLAPCPLRLPPQPPRPPPRSVAWSLPSLPWTNWGRTSCAMHPATSPPTAPPAGLSASVEPELNKARLASLALRRQLLLLLLPGLRQLRKPDWTVSKTTTTRQPCRPLTVPAAKTRRSLTTTTATTSMMKRSRRPSRPTMCGWSTGSTTPAPVLVSQLRPC